MKLITLPVIVSSYYGHIFIKITSRQIDSALRFTSFHRIVLYVCYSVQSQIQSQYWSLLNFIFTRLQIRERKRERERERERMRESKGEKQNAVINATGGKALSSEASATNKTLNLMVFWNVCR